MALHSVVLIAPPLSLEARYGKELKHFGAVTEPLGLAYMAAVLEQEGICVSILDAPAQQWGTADILAHLQKTKPSLVGISLLTPAFGVVHKLCQRIRQTLPGSLLVLGGPHCTALPERTLEEIPWADMVCMGEGEITLKELAQNHPPDTIKGLCRRTREGEIIKNPPRPFIKDLDEIPRPARHLLPMDNYHLTASRTSGSSHCPTLIVARGCPFNCSYCSHTFGRKIRFHSIPRIISEIHELRTTHGISQLNIEADTLTANKKFVTQLCHALIEEKLNIQWTCESRVDTVDEKLLSLMKQAGCWQISYGIETGSQRLLDSINKGVTLAQVEAAIAATHKAKISVRGFFMLGLPTETREESLETIQFAKRLNPLWAQFTLTTPYPGTPMFAQLDREGKIKNHDWENYNTWSGWKASAPLPYVAEGRSVEELAELQKQALRQFYLRPGPALRFLGATRSLGDLKKYARGFWVLAKSKLAPMG